MSAVRRSAIWNVFTETHKSDFIATCNICSQEFSYRSTTTNLMKHLQRKHPNISVDLNSTNIKPKEDMDQTATNESSDPFHEDNLNCDEEYFVAVDQQASEHQSNPLDQPTKQEESFSEMNRESRGDPLHEEIYEGNVAEINQVQINEYTTENISHRESDSYSNGEPSSANNTSSLWDFFTKVSPLNYLAECNLCGKIISFKSTTFNLQKHLDRKHTEVLSTSQLSEVQGEAKTDDNVGMKKPSSVWNYFTKDTFKMTITCNLCQHTSSYRSSQGSTGNLWKHIARKHPDLSDQETSSDEKLNEEDFEKDTKHETVHLNVNEDYDSYESDTKCTQKSSQISKRFSLVWKYFTKLTHSNIPRCNICQLEMSSKSETNNLWKHLNRKHADILADKDYSINAENSDNEETVNNDSNQPTIQNSNVSFNTERTNSDEDTSTRKRSVVWKYFTTTPFSGISCCNLCHAEMTYKSGTTSNLRKHLLRKHPEISDIDVVNVQDGKVNTKKLDTAGAKETKSVGNDLWTKKDGTISHGQRKKTSVVWNYFVILPDSKKPCCKICHVQMSNKSGTRNLMRHIIGKHPEIKPSNNAYSSDEQSDEESYLQKSNASDIKIEQLDNSSEDVNRKRNESEIWNYFTKLSSSSLRCNICRIKISRKLGAGYLWRHISLKHPQIQTEKDSSSSEEDSDSEASTQEYPTEKAGKMKFEIGDSDSTDNEKKGGKKRSGVWKYFTKHPSSNIPRCNICHTEMSSKSGTSNLWRHIFGKHPHIQREKDGSSSEENSGAEVKSKNYKKGKAKKIKSEALDSDSTDNEKRSGKKRSDVWKYFTKLPNSNIPCCNICKAQLSSKSGTSNLWRHIAGKHHNIHKEKEGSSSDEHCDNDSVSEEDFNDTNERKSSIWRYFTVIPNVDRARCNFCEVEMAYRSSTGNLWKHVARKHREESSNINESSSEESSDEEEAENIDINGPHARIWKYFTKVSSSDYLASCNYCQRRFSYRTTISNLKKHLYRKHSRQLSDNSDSDEESERDCGQRDSGKKVSPMWKLFRKVANSDYIACCRLCRKRISYRTTTSNLQRHIGSRHPKYLLQKYRNRISYTARRRNTALCARNAQKYKQELLNFNKTGSNLWNLFSKIEASDSIASCKICRNQLSYKTTTGNLKKHMYRKHRNLLANEQQDQVQSLSELEDEKEEIPDTKEIQNTDNIPIQTVDTMDDDDFWNLDTNTDDDDPDFRPSPTFEEEIDAKNSSPGKKRSLIWNVFTEKPFSNFVAICNVCNQEFCYRSTTNNLKKHFQRKHPKLSLEHKIERVVEEAPSAEEGDGKDDRNNMDDDEKDSSDEAVSSSKRKRSQIWNYFTRKKPGEYVATCNLCKKELGFRSTTSNLKKHLDRKHPHVEIKSESEDVKKEIQEVPVKTCLICLHTDQTEAKEFVQVHNLNPGEGEKNYMIKIQEIMNQPVVIDESHVLCQTCVEDLEKVLQFREKISKAFEFWSKIEAEPDPESFDNFADDVHNSDYSDLEDGESLAKFTCTKCNKVFPSPSVMLKHNCGQQVRKEKSAVKREVIDKDTKYYCEHCGRCFNIKWKLNKHLKKCQNNATKQFVCTLCNRIFKKAYHLREHMASHTGERNYSCNLCGKTFQRSSSKHKHMRSHNAKPGEKSKKTPFLCTICGKSFPYSNGASRHMRVHLGERRHECHICLKRFSQTTHLKVHLRTHSGERPYGCMICGRTFSLNASLRKHMRLHVGSGDFVKLVKNFETNLAPGEMVSTDGLHVLTAVTQDIELDANQCIA